MRRLSAPLLAAAIALAACGPRPLAVAVDAVPAAAVPARIVVVPAPRELPFDPRADRLARAHGAVARAIGHAIAVEIDAALLPDSRAGGEDDLVAIYEALAHDLAALRGDEGAMDAAARIEVVAVRYDVLAREPVAAVDAGGERLVVRGPARGGSLLPRGLAGRALVEASRARADDRFRGRAADDVAPADRAAWFAWITASRPGYGVLSERRDPKAREGLSEADLLATDPHADTILAAARLAELVGPTARDPLAVDVRAWLAAEAATFANVYDRRAELAARLPAASPWKRAEAAWSRWVALAGPALSDGERLRVARALYPSRGRCRDDDPCDDGPVGFPGVDRVAFGLALVDRWRAAGHPTDGEGPAFELMDAVVCPHVRRQDGRLDRNRGSSPGFYRVAAATEAGRARLADEATRRGDPRFVEEILENLDLVPVARAAAMATAIATRACGPGAAAMRAPVAAWARAHGRDGAGVAAALVDAERCRQVAR